MNAYNRYLRGRRISFYLDNVLILDHVQLPSTDDINRLNLRRERTGNCVTWHMNQLEDNAINYILTDLNPCNGTSVVKEAREFLRRNGRRSDASIVPVGMGNEIHSDWLK